MGRTTAPSIALYARFSSDLQEERSLQDQLALCRDHVAKNGGQVVAVYTDAAISGAAMVNRPGLMQLLADAKGGRFDVVMAEGLDRLSRGQSDTPRILEKLTFLGVKIVTLAEGEITELHAGLMGTMNALLLKQIAAKVKRGQIGRLREGKIPGGRCYGYTVTGQGERMIDAAEAEIVRRIFADFAAGKTPFEIAAALNRARIPAPRGGQWNASTINGSRARRNGILNNELYAGRIVYNRQSFRKDPETGKRQARRNPESEWLTTEVPLLRILDNALWDAAQARKRAWCGVRPERQMRPPRLLSGLLRCGMCGGSYTIVRKNVVGCSAHRERGTCDNAKLASLDLIEARVLAGIKEHLLALEVIEAAVRAYRHEMQRLAASERHTHASLVKERDELERKSARLIRAIETGADDVAGLVARLRELEARGKELAAELASLGKPPIALHPRAAEEYRRKVESVQQALNHGEAEARALGIAEVRKLITRVIVIPTPRRAPVEIEIEGELAALLDRNEAGTNSRGAMVAGARSHLYRTRFLIKV